MPSLLQYDNRPGKFWDTTVDQPIMTVHLKWLLHYLPEIASHAYNKMEFVLPKNAIRNHDRFQLYSYEIFGEWRIIREMNSAGLEGISL